METQAKGESESKYEAKSTRPPSSYGSMKSDTDGEEEGQDQGSSVFSVVLPAASGLMDMGMQMIRSESPETLNTMTSHQTVPFGAVVIDTRSELGDLVVEEEEDDHMVEELVTHSPEPHEPVEPEASVQPQENGQPGRLHPEQDLPHIFKSIQVVLTGLTTPDLLAFKMCLLNSKKNKSLQQMIEGDILDFVDKMLEVFGQEDSLLCTINTLKSIKRKTEAEELQNRCKRALIRFHLKQQLILNHQVIREGVPRPGKQNYLNAIYVPPQISTRCCGGVDPSHELRAHLSSPFQIPSEDTFVDLNHLFRLRKTDGQPVRTVITTGIPGIGMTVSVGKFCLDWAELCANKDLQFIIKLSFHCLWALRNSHPQHMSILEVIQYYHPECKDMTFLEVEDCRFLIIMDSFDCYLDPLDWENVPVIKDSCATAHLDVLIVNLIRGTLLPGGCVWILGRRAAVSQIPSQFIDVVTEIQGFSNERKDEYLTKRFSDAELATKIVAHYKRLPTLDILARQPLVCWMVATVFEVCFQSDGYGVHPPRLTPFYVDILILQTDHSLEFYRPENNKIWSNETKLMLVKIGKLAFNMLQRSSCMFSEEDMRECNLNLMEVAVFSGLCTELPSVSSGGRRTFCYVHFTLQEFMAALYVFTVFRLESKNVLDSGWWHMPNIFITKPDQTKSAASLVLRAVELTLRAPLGRYDMFLRFLCGLLAPDCHDEQLRGLLFAHNAAKVSGLAEAQQILQQALTTAQQNNPDQVENLKECLREMVQVQK